MVRSYAKVLKNKKAPPKRWFLQINDYPHMDMQSFYRFGAEGAAGRNECAKFVNKFVQEDPEDRTPAFIESLLDQYGASEIPKTMGLDYHENPEMIARAGEQKVVLNLYQDYSLADADAMERQIEGEEQVEDPEVIKEWEAARAKGETALPLNKWLEQKAEAEKYDDLELMGGIVSISEGPDGDGKLPQVEQENKWRNYQIEPFTPGVSDHITYKIIPRDKEFLDLLKDLEDKKMIEVRPITEQQILMATPDVEITSKAMQDEQDAMESQMLYYTEKAVDIVNQDSIIPPEIKLELIERLHSRFVPTPEYLVKFQELEKSDPEFPPPVISLQEIEKVDNAFIRLAITKVANEPMIPALIKLELVEKMKEPVKTVGVEAAPEAIATQAIQNMPHREVPSAITGPQIKVYMTEGKLDEGVSPRIATPQAPEPVTATTEQVTTSMPGTVAPVIETPMVAVPSETGKKEIIHETRPIAHAQQKMFTTAANKPGVATPPPTTQETIVTPPPTQETVTEKSLDDEAKSEVRLNSNTGSGQKTFENSPDPSTPDPSTFYFKRTSETPKEKEDRLATTSLSILEKRARLPVIEAKAKIELTEEEIKRQRQLEAMEFAASPEGRRLKELQQRANTEEQFRAAKAKYNTAQGPSVVSQVKNAIASNLPGYNREGGELTNRAANLRSLVTPTATGAAAGYAVRNPGQPGQNAVDTPAYAKYGELGSSEIRMRTNPQTGAPEYYIADAGSAYAKKIGGGVQGLAVPYPEQKILSGVGGSTPYRLEGQMPSTLTREGILNYMGASTFQAFESQIARNSDALLLEIGGTTPYPTAANPVDIARAIEPGFVPVNPIEVEKSIDIQLEKVEAPAPKPQPAPMPVPQPVQAPAPAPKPAVQEEVEAPAQAEEAVPEVKKIEHLSLRKKHRPVGAPRLKGRVSKKVQRERDRRARQKAERMRG